MNSEVSITCDKCRGAFEPIAEQKSLIEQARSKGQKFIALQCPLCSRITPFNPMQLIESGIDSTESSDTSCRCPVSGCYGWVSYIIPKSKSDKPFWGCGECGSIWYQEVNLHKEITDIIARFPYRQKVYRKRGKKWITVALSEQPKDYEKQVRREPDGMGKSFKRG